MADYIDLINNLELGKPTSADTLIESLAIFNANIDNIAAAIKSIANVNVIDSGYINGWSYKKWSDGTMECWYTKTGSSGTWSARNGIVAKAGTVFEQTNYPAVFSSRPAEFASLTFTDDKIYKGDGKTEYDFELWPVLNKKNTNEKTGAYLFLANCSATASSKLWPKTNTNYQFNLYVVGRYD